jgi:hypothetical protein
MMEFRKRERERELKARIKYIVHGILLVMFDYSSGAVKISLAGRIPKRDPRGSMSRREMLSAQCSPSPRILREAPLIYALGGSRDLHRITYNAVAVPREE